MKPRKLYVGIAATTLAVGLGGGLAFAKWSATGTGTGGAAATVAQGVTLNPITPSGAAAALYPGGTTAVYFTVTNPNPYPVTITSITWGTPTSTNTTACASANLSIAGANPLTGLTISAPANGTSVAYAQVGVVGLAPGAPDGCEGVGVNVPMTVSGTQS